VVVTRAPSDNANLATIKVNPPLKLSKTSETATEADYTASARNAFSTVTITPTTIDAGATVTVNGDPVTSGATSNDIALAVGQTTVTTVVTAQDGITKKTYIVTVTRAPSDNANMGSLLLSPQLVLTQTAATDGEVDYTASAKSTLGSVTLTPIPWDPTATVTVNGKNVTPGTPSDDITLVTGPNIITAVVTAGDGTTQKTYIITLTKAAASLNTAYQPISVSNPTDRPQMMGEEITVHQGISPNGDGINDFLIIDNIASHPNNKLQIMNRSGQLIYEAVGYDNSANVFDGHSNKNGQMQLPGTYFYSLDYTDNGETKHKTGYIVLKY
jgi:gliding motility-associated-like protein